MTRPVDLVAQPAAVPRESVACDHVLLERVRGGPAVLRIHAFPGDVLSLGRFHLVPWPPAAEGVTLWRRLTGGRAVPAGDGFVGISLVLPHRSALVADEPFALGPAQVLNRCVRGILGACERAGVPAFYPGRDVITVAGRTVALVSLEADGAGACLFEAVLAVGRDFAVLPGFLERADPGGAVRGSMVLPHEVTSLAAELGVRPSFAQVSEWLREGYETRLDVVCRPRHLAQGEHAAVTAAVMGECSDARWLGGRAPRADLDRRVSLPTQMGVLEVHFALAGDHIRDLVLAGDFIAGWQAVQRLEDALRGCAPRVETVAAAVERTLSGPGSFLLGVRPLRAIAEAIARRAGA